MHLQRCVNMRHSAQEAAACAARCRQTHTRPMWGPSWYFVYAHALRSQGMAHKPQPHPDVLSDVPCSRGSFKRLHAGPGPGLRARARPVRAAEVPAEAEARRGREQDDARQWHEQARAGLSPRPPHPPAAPRPPRAHHGLPAQIDPRMSQESNGATCCATATGQNAGGGAGGGAPRVGDPRGRGAGDHPLERDRARRRLGPSRAADAHRQAQARPHQEDL